MRRLILLSVILFQFLSMLTGEKVTVGTLHMMAQNQTCELDDIVVIGHQTDGDDDDYDPDDLWNEGMNIGSDGSGENSGENEGTNWNDESSYNVQGNDGNGSSNNREDDTNESFPQVILENLPKAWRSSDKGHECVTTAMEYVRNILEGCVSINDNYRYYYEDVYNEIDSFGQYDPSENGINPDDREALFSAVFNINQIEGDWILYTTLINEKRPVLTMIEGTYQGQPCNHEVVMVGYSNKKRKFYYIDPSNGLYSYIDYYKIKGPSYKVNSLKNN